MFFSGRSGRACSCSYSVAIIHQFLVCIMDVVLHISCCTLYHVMACGMHLPRSPDLAPSHNHTLKQQRVHGLVGAVLEALEVRNSRWHGKIPGEPRGIVPPSQPNPSLWDSSEVEVSHLPNRESIGCTCLPRLPTEARTHSWILDSWHFLTM